MLALALVPTASGIYLTTYLLDAGETPAASERASQTSETAANLVAHEQSIEARLLVAAADPDMARLANGISGATDKQFADQVVNRLRGGNGGAVTAACVVRSSDGRRIPLVGPAEDPTSACVGGSVRRRALAAPSDVVVRGPAGDGDLARLILATPLRSAGERHHGVLSLELDVAALFDRNRTTGGDAVSSMLVDMGSSEVIAATPADAAPVNGALPPDLTSIAPHVEGLLARDPAAHDELAAMGLAATVVPLWGNGNGSPTGLVQVWSEPPAEMPLEVRLALVAMLAGAILAAIVLVRYFLHPFEEMADSRAELEELYKEAREHALADGLTSLGNHRAFQEELRRRIEEFEKRGSPFSLVLMDLDDLKLVNDRDGHAAGDEMLETMAQTMREQAREGDGLYRIGGDEFAIILRETDIDEAVCVAERMLHFSTRPNGGARPCLFSSGVSGVPAFTSQRDMVYRQADAALYWAKRHGRGAVEVFDPERDQLPDDFNDVTGNAVAEAVTGKLLRPVFQPIVDLRTGRILGFEGLIRPDPNGPLPDTTRLFAAAAASGRTVELDLACIEAVIEGARAIGPDRLLTLNLSPRTLEVKDFDPAWLLSGLMKAGISPSRVIVELTERDEIADLNRLRKTFANLQQYGLRLAADDVGAGNSGLRLLSQVQFDIVKIDLALVQDGVRRVGARTVLESLRDLALSQRARVVAEGVETPRQLQVIRQLDIGAAQGFLLGRPNASVEATYVDVHGLESGLVLPQMDAPATPLWPAGRVSDEDLESIPEERQAIFLPPAGRSFEPGAGVA